MNQLLKINIRLLISTSQRSKIPFPLKLNLYSEEIKMMNISITNLFVYEIKMVTGKNVFWKLFYLDF